MTDIPPAHAPHAPHAAYPAAAKVNGEAAPSLVAKMSRVAAELAKDGRLAGEVVTCPHPLLAAVTRGELMVVLAPAAVWDRGRDLLRPFAPRLADATAMLILMGYPSDVDLAQAMNRGLASIVADAATVDELYLAVVRAFELLEAKGRAESRGKWLRRFRYELGVGENDAEVVRHTRSPLRRDHNSDQCGSGIDIHSQFGALGIHLRNLHCTGACPGG